MRFKGLCICIALVPSLVSASDQAWFRLTGVSSDFQYAVWETGGVQDGSGFPWLRMEVINLETSLPEESVDYLWDDIYDDVEYPDMDQVNRDRIDLFREYEIETEPELDLLLYHPSTDLGVSSDTVVFCLEHYFPGYTSQPIQLTISEEQLSPQEGYPDWFPAPVSLEVICTIQEEQWKLFTESSPPEDYSYVFDYSFAGVYGITGTQGLTLLVFHCETPGFEGSDGRYRVLSGDLRQI